MRSDRNIHEQNQSPVFPIVSIIIPFKNNVEELKVLLEAISTQSYPQSAIEIICIDNSSDPSVKLDRILAAEENVILLSENNYPNSPYSARNRGVERARGDILIFVDANSIPDTIWLEEGVRYLQNSGADIVAGRVNFIYSNPPHGAEVVDAITSIHQKKAVDARGVAYTANLFVRHEIFQKSGLFEEGVRSGGDVRWTTRAVSEGAVIEYCDLSVVRKYARRARALFIKRLRTGSGYYYTWKDEVNRRSWGYNLLRSLKPPSPVGLKDRYTARYGKSLPASLLSVWFFYYSSSVIEQLAFLKEYVRRDSRK